MTCLMGGRKGGDLSDAMEGGREGGMMKPYQSETNYSSVYNITGNLPGFKGHPPDHLSRTCRSVTEAADEVP